MWGLGKELRLSSIWLHKYMYVVACMTYTYMCHMYVLMNFTIIYTMLLYSLLDNSIEYWHSTQSWMVVTLFDPCNNNVKQYQVLPHLSLRVGKWRRREITCLVEILELGISRTKIWRFLYLHSIVHITTEENREPMKSTVCKGGWYSGKLINLKSNEWYHSFQYNYLKN